jgi:hypothetical protein
MKKSILFSICIVVKLTYMKKIIRYFFTLVYLSIEMNNIIITLVIEL